MGATGVLVSGCLFVCWSCPVYVEAVYRCSAMPCVLEMLGGNKSGWDIHQFVRALCTNFSLSGLHRALRGVLSLYDSELTRLDPHADGVAQKSLACFIYLSK